MAEGRVYSCHLCSYKSSTARAVSNLIEHYCITHKSTFNCRYCIRHYPDYKACRFHLNTEHREGEKLVCLFCDHWFFNSTDWKSHMKTVHRKSVDEGHCDVCGDIMPNAQAMRVHVRWVHNKTKRNLAAEAKQDDLSSIRSSANQHRDSHRSGSTASSDQRRDRTRSGSLTNENDRSRDSEPTSARDRSRDDNRSDWSRDSGSRTGSGRRRSDSVHYQGDRDEVPASNDIGRRPKDELSVISVVGGVTGRGVGGDSSVTGGDSRVTGGDSRVTGGDSRVTAAPVFRCGACNMLELYSLEAVYLHFSTTHFPFAYCSYCGFCLEVPSLGAIKSVLADHVTKRHANIPSFTCLFCKQIFQSSAEVWSHVSRAHVEAWEGGRCLRQECQATLTVPPTLLPSRPCLDAHRQQHHPRPSDASPLLIPTDPPQRNSRPPAIAAVTEPKQPSTSYGTTNRRTGPTLADPLTRPDPPTLPHSRDSQSSLVPQNPQPTANHNRAKDQAPPPAPREQEESSPPQKRRRRQPPAEQPATGEMFVCKLCSMQSAYHASVKRHVMCIHKVMDADLSNFVESIPQDGPPVLAPPPSSGSAGIGNAPDSSCHNCRSLTAKYRKYKNRWKRLKQFISNPDG